MLCFVTNLICVYAIKGPFVDTELTFHHCAIDGRHTSRRIWREKTERDGRESRDGMIKRRELQFIDEEIQFLK